MKKILWLSHFIPYPPKGGNLQRSYNLIREVSKSHEITLLTFNQSKIISSSESLNNAITHFSTFCKVADVVDIPSEHSAFRRLCLLLKGLFPWRTYTVSWLESREFANKLEALLQENSFDVIHFDTISLVPYIRHIKNAKLVLNHHNIESLMMLRRAENESHLLKKIYFFLEGKKIAAYEKKVCNSFDLNVTCSDLDTDRLKDHTGVSNCITIPNGVDLEYFKPLDVAIKPKSLIFAGGLTWYPNLDAMTFFLKSVWPLLVKEVPDISMTIIGRSPPSWMLELQDLYPNLKVTGFVDDVRPYIAEAHIYVCPIKDGGGTKLKVLDALSMKKTLVADQIACEGIDVRDQESVFFASSPDEYVRAIKLLIAEPGLAGNIAENGLKLINEKYSFASIGKQLSAAYSDLF
jgi:glycosyltransferase involved in cell wall biosynthesis